MASIKLLNSVANDVRFLFFEDRNNRAIYPEDYDEYTARAQREISADVCTEIMTRINNVG